MHLLLRPLHVAARNGLTVVVQELLAKGASVLAVDENGKFRLVFVFQWIWSRVYFGLSLKNEDNKIRNS